MNSGTSILVDKARIFALAVTAASGKHKYHEAFREKAESDFDSRYESPVVNLVTQYTTDEETIAAAWLYNLTDFDRITIPLLRHEFGNRVAEFVSWLLHPDLTAVQMNPMPQTEVLRLANSPPEVSPPEVQTIKYADVYVRILNISERSPEARRLIPAAYYIMKRLEHGNADLRRLTVDLISTEFSAIDRPEFRF